MIGRGMTCLLAMNKKIEKKQKEQVCGIRDAMRGTKTRQSTASLWGNGVEFVFTCVQQCNRSKMLVGRIERNVRRRFGI
jgi:hypothetical protein